MGGEHRGAGLHLSEVIHYMRVTLGELSDAQTNMGDLWAMHGFVFELWVGQALTTYLSYSDVNLVEPGECEVDGILMNPDRLDVGDGKLWEMKATWKQMKKLIDGGEVNVEGLKKFFWHWLVQVMSYCNALGTRRARIVINFVNGDYTYKPPNGGPQFRAIDLEFTAAEIRENWKMILVNAAGLRQQRGKA